MSTANEYEPMESADPTDVDREFAAPNGEYSPVIALGKLLHLPGFEKHHEDDPTDHLPTAS